MKSKLMTNDAITLWNSQNDYYEYLKKRVPQASAHSSPQELQNKPSADTHAAPNLTSSVSDLIFRLNQSTNHRTDEYYFNLESLLFHLGNSVATKSTKPRHSNLKE